MKKAVVVKKVIEYCEKFSDYEIKIHEDKYSIYIKDCKKGDIYPNQLLMLQLTAELVPEGHSGKEIIYFDDFYYWERVPE